MKDGWMNVKKGAVCISTPIPEKCWTKKKEKNKILFSKLKKNKKNFYWLKL
jgi:hypothetical protein